MNNERATYEEIRNIKTSLETYANDMEQHFQVIDGYFKKVGEDGEVWSGKVAKEAKAVFDTTSKQFPDFIQSVRDEAAHLDYVLASFENADQISQSNLG